MQCFCFEIATLPNIFVQNPKKRKKRKIYWKERYVFYVFVHQLGIFNNLYKTPNVLRIFNHLLPQLTINHIAYAGVRGGVGASHIAYAGVSGGQVKSSGCLGISPKNSTCAIRTGPTMIQPPDTRSGFADVLVMPPCSATLNLSL